MPVTLVLGMQWGDEGKGKVTDFLARRHDYVVRYNGGDNAGHAVQVDGRRFGLRLVPAAIAYAGKKKVLANGLVINPDTLLREVEEIEDAGFDASNLVISDAAHLVLPWHKLLDAASGSATTRRGVGPAYEAKCGRTEAIRVGDLRDARALAPTLRRIAQAKEREIRNRGRAVRLDIPGIARILRRFAKRFGPNIRNTQALLQEAALRGERVLLEGAQGALLDIDHGTYPHVTASTTTAGGASAGTGIAPRRIGRIVGVVKAYATRVGDGPFPTELRGADGEDLRQRGAEFGTAAGCLRRCGWLDLVLLRYAVDLNQPDHLAVTKLDVLAGMRTVKVATAYRIGGRRVERFPGRPRDLLRARPIYRTFEGWPAMPRDEWRARCRRRNLPRPLRRFLDAIARETGVPVRIGSFGPGREDTFVLGSG